MVNTSVNATASFIDTDTLDTHTATWNWGDGTSTTGTVTESSGLGTVTDSHTYTTQGIYTVTLTINDDESGVAIKRFQYISVYDPSPTVLFVGGRRFTSPLGAYPQNPLLTGEVQFGLNARFQSGNPNGNVSMRFAAANLEFTSTALTLLVTPNGQATLRGTGSIVGQTAVYNFLITGLDGAQDAIRIRIKDISGTVIYDSQLGAADNATPITLINSGQIIIH